jgi:hypothetical protein
MTSRCTRSAFRFGRLALPALLACAACRQPSESATASTRESPVVAPSTDTHGAPPAPSADPPSAAAGADLVDVSGDDCTASALVYTHPPGDTTAAGIPFVNDGCFADRIFLGIDGVRRELKRRENVPLGEGGPYSAGDLRARVTRGRLVRRTVSYRPPDAECSGEGETQYWAVYQARVVVTSSRGARAFTGTLERDECIR